MDHGRREGNLSVPRELGGRRYYDLNTKMLDAWLPLVDPKSSKVFRRNRELGPTERGAITAFALLGIGPSHEEIVDRWVNPEGYVSIVFTQNLSVSDGT